SRNLHSAPGQGAGMADSFPSIPHQPAVPIEHDRPGSDLACSGRLLRRGSQSPLRRKPSRPTPAFLPRPDATQTSGLPLTPTRPASPPRTARPAPTPAPPPDTPTPKPFSHQTCAAHDTLCSCTSHLDSPELKGNCAPLCTVFGFQPEFADELGYRKAVPHVMR